jgi:hypothetical protein
MAREAIIAGDIDHPSPASLPHFPQHKVGQVKHRVQIVIYGIAPVGNRNFLEGLAQPTADIVHRYIYWSESSLGVGDEALDLFGI